MPHAVALVVSVVMSHWYQETPRRKLACWMTKTLNSVFLAALLRVTFMIWLPTGVERTFTLAYAL